MLKRSNSARSTPDTITEGETTREQRKLCEYSNNA